MLPAPDHPDSYPSLLTDGPVRGRGANLNPTPRFDRLSLEVLGEHLDHIATETVTEGGRQVKTEVYRDHSRSILNKITSPDIGASWSVNPYRGCEHGCVYCYARPGHEYFGLSSGLDFETKIFAKLDAPELLRKELARPGWKREPIMFSGVTDCYQPIESKLEITRRCMEVFADFRQPITLVTKSRLVLRDLDLLQELNKHHAVHVAVSVTTLDNQLASKLEPRAASPRDRLWTLRRLASAGIPTFAMVAPVIPNINDHEVPHILKAVADAGASSAAYVLLRLPYQLKELMTNWLNEHYPNRRTHTETLLRSARGGKLYDADFDTRMSGTGPYAQNLEQTFQVFKQRYGLNKPIAPLSSDRFRVPADTAQLQLFEAP